MASKGEELVVLEQSLSEHQNTDQLSTVLQEGFGQTLSVLTADLRDCVRSSYAGSELE